MAVVGENSWSATFPNFQLMVLQYMKQNCMHSCVMNVFLTLSNRFETLTRVTAGSSGVGASSESSKMSSKDCRQPSWIPTVRCWQEDLHVIPTALNYLIIKPLDHCIKSTVVSESPANSSATELKFIIRFLRSSCLLTASGSARRLLARCTGSSAAKISRVLNESNHK